MFSPEPLRRLMTQAGRHVVSIEQFQRYPLSNHLYWLSRSHPGCHQLWSFLDTPVLTDACAALLAGNGGCDTLIAHFETTQLNYEHDDNRI